MVDESSEFTRAHTLSAGRPPSHISSYFPPVTLSPQAAIGHVFPIIDRESKINASAGGGTVPASGPAVEAEGGSFKGGIELRGVRFTYPARPSVVVFK